MGRLVLLGISVAAAGAIGVPPPAGAATNPTKAAKKCRAAIARTVTTMARAGLGSIAACHKARIKSGADRDCNRLDEADTLSAYGRAANRGGTVIGSACQPGNPARDNYPGGDVTGVLFPAVTRLLERTGGELQGAPVFTGDPQMVRAKGRCHKAIGTGRNAVVLDVLKRSTGCQKRIDKRASTFSAIDPSCVASPGGSANKAGSKIGKACSAFAGIEVGSCSSLPGCAVDEATRTGQALARITYGGPTACGNGAQELGEDCDDGNTDPGDACTNDCHEARCGDGFVETGVEQCDDGNDIPDDTCRADCTNPVCGDGVLARGAEECDDGNATANDGCTNCVIDPLFCGGEGVLATVVVPYDESVPIAGIQIRLLYPGFLGIPGTGLDTDATRFTDLTDASGAFVPNDQDGAVLVTWSAADAFPPGDFVRILFDCVEGSALRPGDFTCATQQASDPQGNEVMPATVPCAVSAVSLPGGASTSSTTTTLTTTTLGATTTTTILATCGNNATDPGETCDDGNSSNNDACPANCVIESCTPAAGSDRVVTVSFAPPVGVGVAGMTVLLNYPEGRVSIPGSGGSIPAGIITDFPAGASGASNDFDHALRQVVSRTTNMPAGVLFRVHLENCQGAPPPVAGTFSCAVLDAADQNGIDVAGVTCSVSVP